MHAEAQLVQPALSRETVRLKLTSLRAEHAQSLLDFVTRNKAHLAPWEPPKQDSFYTLEHWQHFIDAFLKVRAEGSTQRWALSLKADHHDSIIGTITLSQIFRGPFYSAMLGYSIDQAHEGRGLMHEALLAVISMAFDELGLHRLQAAYVLNNQRSASVLQRLGFEIIGTAKQYLYIHDAWRDHVITQRINPNFNHAPVMSAPKSS